MSTEENADSFTRSVQQTYHQSPSSKQEERAKGLMYLALRTILFILASDFCTFRKILRPGASGFTSVPKECVLPTFITLKIHRLGRV
jgi:hypothetical protein